MAMKRRNFDRVYPIVRFASSAMHRKLQPKRIRETANPKCWSGRRSSRAIRHGDDQASIVAATRQMNQLQRLDNQVTQ